MSRVVPSLAQLQSQELPRHLWTYLLWLILREERAQSEQPLPECEIHGDQIPLVHLDIVLAGQSLAPWCHPLARRFPPARSKGRERHTLRQNYSAERNCDGADSGFREPDD